MRSRSILKMCKLLAVLSLLVQATCFAEPTALVKGARHTIAGSENLDTEVILELSWEGSSSASVQFVAFDAKSNGTFVDYFETSKKEATFQFGDFISENTRLLNLSVSGKKGEEVKNLKLKIFTSIEGKREHVATYQTDQSGQVVSLGDLYQHVSGDKEIWKFGANAISYADLDAFLTTKNLATYTSPGEFEDTAYGLKLKKLEEASQPAPKKTQGIILTKKKETIAELEQSGKINLAKPARISLKKLDGMGLADSDGEVYAVFDITYSADGLYPTIMQKVMEKVLGTACAIDSDNKFDAYVFGNGAKGIGCITLDTFPGYAKKAWSAGSGMHGSTRYSDALEEVYNDVTQDRKLNPNKKIKPITLLFFTDGEDERRSKKAVWVEKLAKIGVYVNFIVINDREIVEERYEKVKTGRTIARKSGIFPFKKTTYEDEYEEKLIIDRYPKFPDLEKLKDRAAGFFLKNVSLSFIPENKVDSITDEELVGMIINQDYKDFVKNGTTKGLWLKTPSQLGML